MSVDAFVVRRLHPVIRCSSDEYIARAISSSIRITRAMGVRAVGFGDGVHMRHYIADARVGSGGGAGRGGGAGVGRAGDNDSMRVVSHCHDRHAAHRRRRNPERRHVL